MCHFLRPRESSLSYDQQPHMERDSSGWKREGKVLRSWSTVADEYSGFVDFYSFRFILPLITSCGRFMKEIFTGLKHDHDSKICVTILHFHVGSSFSSLPTLDCWKFSNRYTWTLQSYAKHNLLLHVGSSFSSLPTLWRVPILQARFLSYAWLSLTYWSIAFKRFIWHVPKN